MVDPLADRFVLHGDLCAGNFGDFTLFFSQDQIGTIRCSLTLHTSSDIRRFGAYQRHSLALHVGTHQGAVGIVVLKERNQSRRHRHDLLRRYVNELHLIRWNHLDVGGGTKEAFGFKHALQVGEAGSLR